jgi:hypothetical protein
LIGYGQNFSGGNEYDLFYLGDLGMHDGIQKNISFSAWVKLDRERSDTWGKILAKRNALDTSYGNYLHLNDATPRRIVGNINNHALGSYVYPNMTWMYFTISYNGSSMVEFINGSAYSTQSWSDALIYSNSPWTIGGRETWGQEIKGFIDEVRISNAPRSEAWVKAEYYNQYSPGSFYSVGDWVSRKALTLNASMVAGDLTNFPVYINITDSDLSADARPDGHDIYFTSSDGETKLDHEFTYYEPDTGNLRAWIKIPTLSSTTNTTIYMYYNNNDAGNNSNSPGVWDDNYRGVWHLMEYPVGTSANQIKDSSSRSNHLQPRNGMDSTDQIPGRIDGSLEFDGSDDEIRRLDADAPTLNFGTSDLTIESWVYIDMDNVVSYPTILERGAQSDSDPGYWLFWHESNNYIRFYIGDGTSRAVVNSYSGIQDGAWHHIAAVADRDGKGMLYIDGRLDNGDDWTAWDGNSIDKSGIFSISDDSSTWDGGIDEVRISASVRSWEWINTSYQNQNNASAFVSVGTEEDLDVWYSSSWSYRKNITINSEMVGGGVKDFPIMINITDTDLMSDARSDGNDIIFTQGTALLDFEVETYDSSTGEILAWVEVPYVSSVRDKNITMYYGNSGQSTSMEDEEGTWSNGFVGVYHMSEASGSISNSATSSNDGTRGDSPTRVSSRVGYGQEFTGTTGDDRFLLGDFGLTNGIQDKLTLSYWLNADDSALDDWARVVNKRDETDTNTLWGTYFDDDATAKDLFFNAGDDGGANQVGLGVWVYVSLTYDGSTKIHYHNGTFMRDDTGGGGPLSPTVSTATVTIGAREGGGQNYAGILDEVRIASVYRTAGWILTEYNNMNDSATFLSVGSEQTDPTSPESSSGTYYEWVELYNPTSQTSNLNDLFLFDNDGGSFDLSGAGSIAPGGYLICHLGEAGTNSSTDVYGPVFNTHKSTGSMLDIYDDLTLASSQGYAFEYLSWGVSAEADDDIAVSLGEWYPGDFINSTDLSTNETLGRDKFSTENNATADWENPDTNLADPYGLHAWGQTSGAINLDSQIVINEVLYDPANNRAFGDWGNRKKITIDTSKVLGDLINFPVMISMTDTDLAGRAQSDGDDIMFIASDGTTKYRHEIESYDSSTGTLVAWVNVTSLSPSTDTEFYMYYNNPSASNQSNVTGVWDSNFRGVWHLNDTSGSARDSTSYGVSGTVSGSITQGASGQIDGAYDFDPASSPNVDMGDPADGHLDFGTGSFTFGCWVNIDASTGTWQNIVDKRGGSSNPGFLIYTATDASYYRYVINDGTDTVDSAQIDLNLDTWTHLVGVVNRSDDKIHVYKDGQEVGTGIDISIVDSVSSSEPFMVSRNNVDGLVDEVRISYSTRSADWINASYLNQLDPDSFYSVGPEELNPDAWLYKKNLTIASSLVDGDLTDFPILVSITDSDLSAKARPDGYDIAFTSSNDNYLLNSEVERYFTTTGELVAWVNVTSLKASTDTYLNMYYGNPDCFDQSSSEDVWDDDYVGVWHLNETLGTSIDATSNTNDASPFGDISQISEGVIAYGDEFDGTSNTELAIADSAAMEPSSLTIELWWNTDELPAADGDYRAVFSDSEDDWSAGYTMGLYRNDGSGFDGFQFFADFGVWDPVEYPTSSIDPNVWYWAAATYDGGADGSELFINGTSVDTAATTGPIADTSVDINIGNHDWNEWMGELDEIRLSKAVRSDAWISTSFNTQNFTDTFISVGAEETTGASPGYEWVEVFNRGDTSVDLTGWYITDNDGNKFYLTGAGSIAADSYVVAHLAKAGTNSSTDVYGAIEAQRTTQSITIQPGPTNGKDVHLYQGSPTDRNGADNYFEIADYNDGGEERILFEFNMSYIPGSTIIDANLWLWRHGGSGTDPGHHNVRRVTRNWTEAFVDWNNYDSGNPWSNGGGGDFTDKVYTWKTVNPSVLKWYYFNVTELIQEWKDGTYENYGLALEAHWSSSWQQFRSSDYYTDLTLRPKLIVNYSVPTYLIDMLEDSDDLSLCDSSGTVVDYIAWGANPAEDDDSAVTRGLWTAGAYIDTSALLQNETIGRDRFSTDLDVIGDWENATTNKADPYGVNSTEQTEGAINWFVIPEFSDYGFVIILIAVISIFVCFRKKREA